MEKRNVCSPRPVLWTGKEEGKTEETCDVTTPNRMLYKIDFFVPCNHRVMINELPFFFPDGIQ